MLEDIDPRLASSQDMTSGVRQTGAGFREETMPSASGADFQGGEEERDGNSGALTSDVLSIGVLAQLLAVATGMGVTLISAIF